MWRMLKTRWKQWRNAGTGCLKFLERCKKKKLCKRIKGTVKTLRKVFAIEKGKKRKLSTISAIGMQNFSTEFLLEKIAVVFSLPIRYNIIFSCCSVCVLFCRQSSRKGYGKQLYRNCIFLSSHGKFYVIITSRRKRKPASQKARCLPTPEENIENIGQKVSVTFRKRPKAFDGLDVLDNLTA